MCREFIKLWSCGHEHSNQHDPCRDWRRGITVCEVTDVVSTIQGLCPDCRSSTGSDRSRTRTERAYDATRGMDRIFRAPSRSPSPPRHRSRRRSSSTFGPSSYPSPPPPASASASGRSTTSSRRSSSRRPSTTSTSTNPIRDSIRNFMENMSLRSSHTYGTPSPVSPTLRSPPLNHSHRRPRRSSQTLVPSSSSTPSSSSLTRSRSSNGGSSRRHRSSHRSDDAFTSYRDPASRSRSPTASRHSCNRPSVTATYAYRERSVHSDGRFRDHGGVFRWSNNGNNHRHNHGSDSSDDSDGDMGFGFGRGGGSLERGFGGY